MHRYFIDNSSWKKALPADIESRILKNHRTPKQHLAEKYFSEQVKLSSDLQEIHTSPKKSQLKIPRVYSPPTTLGESKSSEKFDLLLSKLSCSPQSKSNRSYDIIFRKRLTKNIQDLKNVGGFDLVEQKEVVKSFGDTTKGNMFSTTKGGIKFRVSKLKKEIGMGFNRNIDRK